MLDISASNMLKETFAASKFLGGLIIDPSQL